MNNKRTLLTIAPIVAAVLLLIMTTTTQTTQASIPTTPLHHKFPDKVAGYDDCSFLSESAKINHIRNCYGYDDTRLYTSTLDHSKPLSTARYATEPTDNTTTKPICNYRMYRQHWLCARRGVWIMETTPTSGGRGTGTDGWLARMTLQLGCTKIHVSN